MCARYRRHLQREQARTVNPRVALRVHRILMGVWALLAIPTLLWWRESILWVAFMSLYANFVGHASAAEAAEAKLDIEEEQS